MDTEVVAHLALDLLDVLDMEHWYKDDTEEGETRWQNVLELITVMHKYDALEPHESLTSFLEEVSLVSEVDKLHDATGDALTLMTLHLCKGLEFDHVIITGCEEGVFPHSNSLLDREQLEEECRLMYVGMTRAKKYLKLLCARSRSLWGEVMANAPSRFLDELPDAVTERRSDDVLSAFAWASKSGQQKAFCKIDPNRAVEDNDLGDIDFNQDVPLGENINQESLTIGTRIEHPTFGTGTIVGRRGDVIEVEFDSGGSKHLALSIAPITVL
jgi:DNA helicase-2/ATP-dependent DNA helicase PcrA